LLKLLLFLYVVGGGELLGLGIIIILLPLPFPEVDVIFAVVVGGNRMVVAPDFGVVLGCRLLSPIGSNFRFLLLVGFTRGVSRNRSRNEEKKEMALGDRPIEESAAMAAVWLYGFCKSGIMQIHYLIGFGANHSP
jgi:hypothetical protein